MTSTTPENNRQTTGNTDGDNFAALALLAGLTGTANADQMRLLHIITDPSLSSGTVEGETPLEMADYYEENFSDYLDWNHNWQVETIADFLYTHYSADPSQPDFIFGFTSNAEGEVGGTTISASFGDDYNDAVRAYQFLDIKHTTYDREAKGLAAALAIAQALDSTYQHLITVGRKRGLLTTGADLLEKAAAALTVYDATPSGEDADADTVADLRDALASLLVAQGVTLATPAPPCGDPREDCLDHDGTCD